MLRFIGIAQLSLRLALLNFALTSVANAQDCTQRLLVSGYTSDNVHVFDLCNGEFERLLDSGGRLDGTQAVREGNGFLYVASEENNRIVRYNAQTLQFVDIFIESGDIGVSKPTGLAIGPAGDVFVAGFTTTAVVRLDGQTGVEKQRYSLAGQSAGIDAGMAFLPDGRLLVPGFDSDNIMAINVSSGEISELVAAGTAGLRSPRVIHVDDDRSRLLVTAWGSGRVLAFAYDGTFLEQVVTRAQPSGLTLDANGNLLVVSDQQARVVKYSPAGVQSEVVVDTGSGGIIGATFLTLTGSQGVTEVVTSPDQTWLIGVGGFEGNTLIAEMVITDGTAFGDAFDPAAVRRVPWGTVEFEVTGCASANFAWQGLDAAYGSGGYPVMRVAPNLAEQRCITDGLSPQASQGTWFGGPSRDGEGLLIDMLDNGQAVITVYTYRPTAP